MWIEVAVGVVVAGVVKYGGDRFCRPIMRVQQQPNVSFDWQGAGIPWGTRKARNGQVQICAHSPTPRT